MKHEDLKRELAAKATQGPWGAQVAELGDGYAIVGFGVSHEPTRTMTEIEAAQKRAGADAQHIAFHDPETALLEAEVISAARAHMSTLPRDGADGLDFAYERMRVRDALAALDAHHAKRETK